MKTRILALASLFIISANSYAAQRSEIEKLYASQTPGSLIRCTMNQESFFTDVDFVTNLTVTSNNGNKTKMDARILTKATGMGQRMNFLATFKTTRTMLDNHDTWVPDMTTLVLSSPDGSIKESDLSKFKEEFKEGIAFTTDQHSNIYLKNDSDYEIGQPSSGLFSSKSAMLCSTLFSKDK
ncbi:hypothetical protein [Kluyvera ascorbata]|uniref:hypothetical protein n=1 Tax=Kluyvera ascorbata TaxID=51288 RepID=UPI002903FEAD|nr:hypothetical protein [Kluyvera ascorbata]MDU1196840.1 hypothetical protein [Kluyvera ascorbata]